jgi:hypothetical protein
LIVALLIFAAFTCSTSDNAGACQLPPEGSAQADLLADARSQAAFPVRFPCHLPGATSLESVAVTGTPGRQKVELIFNGPFELAVRQSQFPPAVNPDPTGATRSDVDLFPNVPAILIERNDGSSKALYHLYWESQGIFYEVQAVGPPLQRRQVLQIATSLEEPA